MRHLPRRPVLGLLPVLGLATATLAACTSAPVPDSSPSASVAVPPSPDPRILVFSKTAGFRHESIPAGIETIRALGASRAAAGSSSVASAPAAAGSSFVASAPAGAPVATGAGFAVDATEDGRAFTPGNLTRYRAVVFLNTSGNVLDPDQQAAFEAYIRGGGGFVGVHSAADTEYDWPFYGDLVGAYFADHPAIQQAVIRVEDRSHPATAGLGLGPGQTWTRTDEWYNFRTRPAAHLLLSLDESSYTGGTMGPGHPHAWYRAYQGGRSFYTAGGHTIESYAEPAFRAHLLGGIRYAAGLPG